MRSRCNATGAIAGSETTCGDHRTSGSSRGAMIGRQVGPRQLEASKPVEHPEPSKAALVTAANVANYVAPSCVRVTKRICLKGDCKNCWCGRRPPTTLP